MALHADKLRWLFWLRWKMLLRGFTRDKGRVIGLVLLLLFGLPFVIGIAALTFLAYRHLPSPANMEVLFLVLTVVYLLWAVLPLLEYTINEGLDISKLALFPLTRAELMVSLLFSTLLDVPTVGLLLVFAAVVAGWAVSLPVALMALLTMLVFFVQVIGTSQLILALLMRTLQSRRFRDLSIILVALFSSSCYLFQQLALRGLGSEHLLDHLEQQPFSPYLQWFPPGMAARAIEQAVIGNWGISFAWLGVLLALSVVILYLWQLVVERGLTTTESGGAVRTRRAEVGPVALGREQPLRTGILGRILSSQAIAIAVKDIKYFRRDPQLQASFVSSIMSILILIVITFVNPSAEMRSTFGSWTVLAAPAFMFFSLLVFSSNVLGMERQSLTELFLFPVEPRHILWGKNGVVFLLGLVEMSLLVLLAAFVSRAWNLVLPAFVVGIAGIGVILGCGNFTSIFFPQRMRQIRRGFSTTSNLSSESGCLRAVMSMVMLLVTLVVLSPVVLAVVVPLFFNVEWIWAFSIPASLLYGTVFYYVVTALVAPRMLERIPEILEVVARE
jgi:ABC-2 type transport system permease protein